MNVLCPRELCFRFCSESIGMEVLTALQCFGTSRVFLVCLHATEKLYTLVSCLNNTEQKQAYILVN